MASGVVSSTEIELKRGTTISAWDLWNTSDLGDPIRAFYGGCCETVCVILEEEGGLLFGIECSPDQRIMINNRKHGTWTCAKDVRPGMRVMCRPRKEESERSFIWPPIRSVDETGRFVNVYNCHSLKGVELGPNGFRRIGSYVVNRVVCLPLGEEGKCPCDDCRDATAEHLAELVEQKLVL